MSAYKKISIIIFDFEKICMNKHYISTFVRVTFFGIDDVLLEKPKTIKASMSCSFMSCFHSNNNNLLKSIKCYTNLKYQL